MELLRNYVIVLFYFCLLINLKSDEEIFMIFLKRIDDDIRNYGKNGDRTLEYIGVNLEDGIYKEYKCYRFMQQKNVDFLKWNEVFEESNYFRKLDFQYNDKEQMYRFAYKVDDYKCVGSDDLLCNIINVIKKSGYEKFEKNAININDYIKKLLKTNIDPICVIGGKINKYKEITTLKLYYKLKADVNCSIDICNLKKIKNSLFDMLKEKMEKREEDIILKRIIKKFFEPIMLGIDIEENEISKIKYYFLAKDILEPKVFVEEVSHLKSEFGDIVDKVVAINNIMFQKKLWLRGIATSLFKNAVNLYFCEI